jgi:hypothetical protein
LAFGSTCSELLLAGIFPDGKNPDSQTGYSELIRAQGSTIDNPPLGEAKFGCCVGRIGADRKGNAHLR